MAREITPIRPGQRFLIALALFAAGCGASPGVDSPPLAGRRVQSTSVVAEGAVPYQVGAYELTFADGQGVDPQARRAALLVDLTQGHGHARGFVEWGKPGQSPSTFVVGGWARQRAVGGQTVTVFDLNLDALDVRGARREATEAERLRPPTLRVVVNEASGAVTLTSRR